MHLILCNFPFINVAHDRSVSKSSENLQRMEYAMNQNPYAESVKASPSEQFADQTSSKLKEYKSLCKSLFPGINSDILLRKMELEHKGKESPLDDTLQKLRWIEALRIQTSSKGLEKPPLSSHHQLGDLPPEATNRLAKIEQLISRTYHPNYVFEEIERLAGAYSITNDLDILNAALDHQKRLQDPDRYSTT